MVGRGTKGFGRGGLRVLGGEAKICTTEQSKRGGFGRCWRCLFTVLRRRVNRDGTATGRECGPEWLRSSRAPPVCQRRNRVGTGRPLSHANELSVTSSTPTPAVARPRTNMTPPPKKNEHLFSAPCRYMCGLTAGRLSAWLHCVALPQVASLTCGKHSYLSLRVSGTR